MKTITKGLIGTVAAGAMAMASASPAFAQRDRGHHDNNGISAGEVIAGALIIGGIAAIASSSNNRGRDYRDGRGGYGDRDARRAVEQCVNAAERQASRASWQSRADVTDIRSIRENRNGYTVKGRIAVNTQKRDWRDGDRRYGNGWGNDYRGWNDNLRGYDAGNFTCKVNYNGRISDIDFNGIRGLR